MTLYPGRPSFIAERFLRSFFTARRAAFKDHLLIIILVVNLYRTLFFVSIGKSETERDGRLGGIEAGWWHLIGRDIYILVISESHGNI